MGSSSKSIVDRVRAVTTATDLLEGSEILAWKTQLRDLVSAQAYVEGHALVERAPPPLLNDAEFLYLAGVSCGYGGKDHVRALELLNKARALGNESSWVDYHAACFAIDLKDHDEFALRLIACLGRGGEAAPVLQFLLGALEKAQLDPKAFIARGVLRAFAEHAHALNESAEGLESEALRDKGLFIIGPAGSGTSMTIDHLNSFPNVCLFSELDYGILQTYPNHYAAYGGDTPIAHYNAKSLDQDNPVHAKGYSIPLALDLAMKQGRFWQEAARDYQFVGEKVALSYEKHPGGRLLDLTAAWHAARAPYARYVLCLRDPAATAASLANRFGRGGAELIDYIIASTEVTLQLWRTLPRSVLAPYTMWTRAAQGRLQRWLELDGPIVLSKLQPKSDKFQSERLPSSLIEYADVLEQLSIGYREALDRLSAEGPFAYDFAFAERLQSACRDGRQAMISSL